MAFYAKERAPKLADPGATAARVKTLLGWWGEKHPYLSDVKLSTCRAYVEHRTKQPLKQARRGAALAKRVTIEGARRELEDLSAAITFWTKEHPLTSRPVVTLPPKAESPRDALTRAQAARLLKASLGWRWAPSKGVGQTDTLTQDQGGRWVRLSKSARANRAHLRRFILIGLYTGTRPGVIPKLLWEEAATQAWVDLDAGTIYRRGKREREHRTKKRPLVKVPRRLLAHLRRWRRLDLAAAPSAAEAASSGQKASSSPRTAPTAVLHHGGESITGKIRRGFAACVRDAGLDPDITPHWLRHTCATWLMEAGVDPWDAAGFTGMTTATLEKCYGHHRPDHQDKARRALGGRK